MACASTPLLRRGEVLGDRARQPALALAAVLLQRPQPCAVSSTSMRRRVGRVGAACDQPVGLEVADRLRHRLRRTRSATASSPIDSRPLAVQAPEHGALGEREAVLGAQPAHQLAEHHAQLARQAGGVYGLSHGSQTI